MNHYPAGRLALESSELQRLLAQVPFSVVIYEGREHKPVFSNAAHDEMTGGRLRLGVPLLSSLPELAGQPVMRVLDAVYATGLTQSAERVSAQLVRGGRLEECWFRVTWQAVKDNAGHTTGVIASAVEVTQLVTSQRALDLARAEAERLVDLASQNERHFHEVVDNLPMLVWCASADGNVDYYNRSWYEYTGTTWDTMKSAGWHSVPPPDDHERVVTGWQRALETGDPFEMEFPLRRFDGVFCPFVTRIMPLRSSAGELLRWYALISETPARGPGRSSYDVS